MRNHLAADLAEPGETAFDVEEAVGIHTADVAGPEPALLDYFLRLLWVFEVASENIGALEPDHATLVHAERFVGFRIGDAHGHAGQKLADAARAVAWED